MSNFDESEAGLKQEMQRVSAPDGFADRVMARVGAQERKGRLMGMPKRAVWSSGWMAIAAVLLVGIMLGGLQWRQHELRKEREEAEILQRQFDLAMQVTQRTLAGVQMRVGKTVRDSVRQ